MYALAGTVRCVIEPATDALKCCRAIYPAAFFYALLEGKQCKMEKILEKSVLIKLNVEGGLICCVKNHELVCG